MRMMVGKNKLWMLLLVLAMLLTGCNTGDGKKVEKEVSVLDKEWEDIVFDAKGSKVNLFMWGGDEGINRYIDDWVAPRLKDEFDVELKRYPMDATEFLNKLISEKQAGKKTGEMDVLWLNGENFKNAKENDLLLGTITEKLPNFQKYIEVNSPDVQYDFGFPTEGYEAPWGKVQFVFSYDSSKITNPPGSIEELQAWVKANPGKFTYPAPPDFTGSAFIRHVLNETSKDYSAYLDGYNESLIKEEASGVWKALNELEPYLWRKGTSYPQSLAQLDQLYKNGEVWMTMGYDEAGASNLIANGEFPETTKTFVLEKGTLANTHFLTVPYNAPNSEGALVLINFLLSPSAQLKKMDLDYWGENTVLSLERLSDEDRKAFEAVDRGQATLSEEILSKHRLPEISAEYVQWLERGWMNHVANE